MRASSGFSLLEIIAALVVAGVFLVIAVPSWQAMEREYRVATAADQLAAEIQTARLLAVSRNATLQLAVNASAGSYQIIDVDDASNPPRTAKTLPSGVTFQTTPGQPLTFYARGNVQGGTITLGNGNFNRQLTVTASGRVRVQ